MITVFNRTAQYVRFNGTGTGAGGIGTAAD